MKRLISSRSVSLLHLSKPLLIPLMAFNPIATVLAEEQSDQLETTEVVASPIIEENHLDAFSDVSAIVTEEQLRDQNAVDLASALRRTPGVQITRFNPVGSFGGNEGGGVFIRGMGQSRPGSEIKTYIDEIPVYMPVWGHPLLDLLPINGMQSITTYKSPQPHINGNNFASINLETKRAMEDGIHGHGRFSGGFYDTFIEQADIAGKQGDLDFALAQGYSTSNGHRDHADGELKNVMGRIGYKLNENWSVGTHFLYTDNQASDPGDNRLPKPTIAPRYTTEAGMVAINLAHYHGDWHGDLQLYNTTGKGNWYNHIGNDGHSITDTLTRFDTRGLRWKEQFSPWQGGEMVAGIDSDWASGDVSDPVDLVMSQGQYQTPTFRTTSPFVALSQTIQLNKNWSLVPSAGVRYYDHSEFESASSPHAGISLVSDRVTLFANFSRGINYPGLEVATLSKYMAFIPNFSQTWPKLGAEELQHGEVGVKLLPTDSTQIDFCAFNDRVKNRYFFQFAPTPVVTNFGEYSVRGFEGMIKQGLGHDWSVFAGLTLLNPSIDNLPYAPARAVTAGVNGQIEGVRLAVDAQYQSSISTLNRSRVGVPNNTETVSSFVVVNARASYPIPQLGKDGEVFIAAENLLDRDYRYRPGYPMPGRWGQIGFSASF